MALPTDTDSDAALPDGSTGNSPPIKAPVMPADATPPGGSPDDPGGELEIDDGPDAEPSVAALRAEILEKVAAYARRRWTPQTYICLLYTSDAADEEDSVDLGGRRIIKKKKK